MGCRFRQALRVFPGLRLNLSKSGVSTSLGTQGATLNVSTKGIRGTAGIPGSGVSYSQMVLPVRGGAASSAPRMAKPTDQPKQDGGKSARSQTKEEALDELYFLTAHLVVRNANASTSWLQRQLRVEYSDAADLIAQLEADGIVSPPDRIGRRKVLVDVLSLPELPDAGTNA
jgi:DNA segregation ATPase FtsK/SpoIIIE-like protein